MNPVSKNKRAGLQEKTIIMVLAMLITLATAFVMLLRYQNRMLQSVVGQTRTDQQQAISSSSQETMHQILTNTFAQTTKLQAEIANKDFEEVINNTYLLQSMAQTLFDNRKSLLPAEVSPPNPAMDGRPSAMVLCEENVDYTKSKLVGIAAHLTDAMIAMLRNSKKLDACYMGLADGTHLCVDKKPLLKLDDLGHPISFPVRQRPWYRGAAETGMLFFTGIEEDAFSKELLITCSAPVYSDSRLVGVVGIDIILESMEDFVKTASGSAGLAFIVNNNGQVVLSSEDSGIFAAEKSDQATDLRTLNNDKLTRFINQALVEETGMTTLTVDGKRYYAAGTPIPAVGWAMISIVGKEVTEQPEKMLLAEYDRINDEASLKFRSRSLKAERSGWILISLIFLVSVAVALFGARRIVNPIREMTNSIVRSSQTGELFQMKPVYQTHDEIQVLAESFDDLSKKTKQYIEDITVITQEKERVNTELNMANQIQSSMLPHIFPAFPSRSEFDIYASMTPAKEVGGDFYDFFLIDDDHLCMVIADVSGKGVPAALFMMVSKAIIKNNAMSGRSVGEILKMTNETICSNNKMQMFVTVWIGILEISTGKITAANAGHEYPAIMQNGRFELLHDKHGFIIGGMEGIRYKEYEIRLEKGDKIFLYTDGVPEATDAENNMFGTDRMIDALNRDASAPPEDIAHHIRKSVDEFVNGAEQFDDLTMLCLEYRGKSEEPET